MKILNLSKTDFSEEEIYELREKSHKLYIELATIINGRNGNEVVNTLVYLLGDLFVQNTTYQREDDFIKVINIALKSRFNQYREKVKKN